MNEQNERPVIHEQGPGVPGGRSTRALSIKRLYDFEGLRAVDLGSNEGYNSFDLLENGCKEVLGVEVRDRYLRNANEEKQELGYDNVSFVKGDVRVIDELGLGKYDLCLCAGLLYHMKNPFNLLKRIRNICKVLALETHISPSWYTYFRAGKKYRQNLTLRTYRLTLDDVSFYGRLNIFPPAQDMQKISASIVSRTTFWLDRHSLERALYLSGFRIVALYYNKIPIGKPEIYINHGYYRTKVFILAEVKEPDKNIFVQESNINGCKWLQNDMADRFEMQKRRFFK